MKRLVTLIFLLAGCASSAPSDPPASDVGTVAQTPPDPAAPTERRLELVYALEVEGVPSGGAALDIWLPVPPTSAWQTVHSFTVTGDVEGTQRPLNDRYGNHVWHARVDAPDGAPILLTATTVVTRMTREAGKGTATAYTPEETAEGAPFLVAEARVPVDGEAVDAISADIAPGETNPATLSRAVYDFVVDNMDYKKTGTGWGNGDTYWACSEKYGNCTDFHALFNSLTRNKGLPSRFSIGFPVPLERAEGSIGGYHCWADVLLPGQGWLAVDASEAKKHLEKRELLYGTLPPDRVAFSSGRDLDVGQKSGPLNYFVDAHVEVGGVKWTRWRKTLTYRVLAP